METISILARKGGAGKSTLTLHQRQAPPTMGFLPPLHVMLGTGGVGEMIHDGHRVHEDVQSSGLCSFPRSGGAIGQRDFPLHGFLTETGPGGPSIPPGALPQPGGAGR